MKKKRKEKERKERCTHIQERVSGNQEKEFDHVVIILDFYICYLWLFFHQVHSLWTTALRVQALHAHDNTTNKRYYEMKSQLGTEINESKYKEEMNAARKKQHDEEEKRKMRSKYKTAKLW